MRPISRLEPDQRPPRVLPFSFFARDGIFSGLFFGLLPTDHGRDAQGLLELAASFRFGTGQESTNEALEYRGRSGADRVSDFIRELLAGRAASSSNDGAFRSAAHGLDDGHGPFLLDLVREELRRDGVRVSPIRVQGIIRKLRRSLQEFLSIMLQNDARRRLRINRAPEPSNSIGRPVLPEDLPF